MKHPSILMIVADQLSAKALNVFGNQYFKTPNIDRLAARGLAFENCYTGCPVCMPARASFWTGTFPHENGVLSNRINLPDRPDLLATEKMKSLDGIGDALRKVGYDPIHFGKQHSGGGVESESFPVSVVHEFGGLKGFRCEPPADDESVVQHDIFPISSDSRQDENTLKQALSFLEHRNGEPVALAVDLNNPHEICTWVNQWYAEKQPGYPFPVRAPYFFPENVSAYSELPFTVDDCSYRYRPDWNEDHLKKYYAAYQHYLTEFDTAVGKLMNAVDERDDAEDFLIVLISDHGEALGAHGLALKGMYFYEETVRVPMIFAGKGIERRAEPIPQLVSLVDLMPTILEIFSIPVPEKRWGKSLLPLLKNPDSDRKIHPYVVSEWQANVYEQDCPGRMIRTEQFKYCFHERNSAELLFDLKNDPGELYNLAEDPDSSDVLQSMRNQLTEWMQERNDPFLSLFRKKEDLRTRQSA